MAIFFWIFQPPFLAPLLGIFWIFRKPFLCVLRSLLAILQTVTAELLSSFSRIFLAISLLGCCCFNFIFWRRAVSEKFLWILFAPFFCICALFYHIAIFLAPIPLASIHVIAIFFSPFALIFSLIECH